MSDHAARDQTELERLLRLYLGEHAGLAVARGAVRRGESIKVVAAILLADIRGSTPLIRDLGMEAYIDMLNRCFDTITPPITKRDGEVLQFTGDGALAVFPESEDAKAQGIVCPIATAAAFEAAREADSLMKRCGLDCQIGFGLSYGPVAYGNVGAANRLTFTVISEEVSRADRLQRLCPIDGTFIAMSETFASALPKGTTYPVGTRELKGFDEAGEVFVPI